jgi:hypothetical protein
MGQFGKDGCADFWTHCEPITFKNPLESSPLLFWLIPKKDRLDRPHPATFVLVTF